MRAHLQSGIDCLIAEVADRQEGVVSHAQLIAQGRWITGVLAIGADARLSCRAAGAHWGVRGWSGITEVTVPHQIRSRRAIRVHVADLAPDEVTIHHGIPITTIPRTLLDLAAILPRDQAEAAARQAEIRRLTDPLSLKDLATRHHGRPGAATLRAIADAGRLSTATRSELEDAFLALAGRAALPIPEVNARVEGFYVDAVWRKERLAVELDSREWHDNPVAFEEDRARDRVLAVAGWRVMRITSRQLRDEPGAVAADLRALLALH